MLGKCCLSPLAPKEVDRALASNRVTVAVLPFTQLVAPGEYLVMLKERGYCVEEPE